MNKTSYIFTPLKDKSMKQRLLRVLSVPFALAVMVPMIIICALLWVATNKYSPFEIMDRYFEWFDYASK